MTQISDAATTAREQARDNTDGTFGTQPHAESGIVQATCSSCRRPEAECSASPCLAVLMDRDNPPSIDTYEATDKAIEEWSEDDFEDDKDSISFQIRAAVDGIEVAGKPLSVEPACDDEDSHMFGVDIGFHDRAHGTVISMFVETDDFCEGISGLVGRERARFIVEGIVKRYDAVHDSYFPRAV